MPDRIASLRRLCGRSFGCAAILSAGALGIWLGLGVFSTAATAQSCCTLRGNVDCDPDGNIDIADFTRLIDYMYITMAPLCCDSAANIDADPDGIIDIADLTRLVDYMYISFQPLPTCGADQSLTYAQRLVLFDALDSAYHSLTGSPDSMVAAKLAVFLNSRSEIDSAGVVDGISVWAWFVDGRTISMPNNRPPTGNGMADDSWPESTFETTVPENFVIPKRRFPNPSNPAMETAPQQPALAADNYELPTTVQARVIATLGTGCFTIGAPKIKSLLESHGYVTVPTSGSVPSLFNIHDDGVFYIDAHGGVFASINGINQLAVWTATPVSPANDATYASQLATGELVYMMESDTHPVSGACSNHFRYGFTGKFVAQYMSFAPHSVVFLNACETDRFPSLRQGFFSAGASVFCGWTRVVGDNAANRAAEFLFDRMLGANASVLTPKESPPQRPFDVDPLWQDMKTRGFDTDPNTGAKLVVERLSQNFGLLAPSIEVMQVSEHNDSLFLSGMFGSNPGSHGRVIVGGTELIVGRWDPDVISAFIPNTGVGSVGPVHVEVDGITGPSYSVKRMSNVVNLTEWNGQFDYKLNGAGTLKQTITIKPHIRADIHSFRDQPHQPPLKSSQIISCAENSEASAEASGTFVIPNPPQLGGDLVWIWYGSTVIPGDWNEGTTNQMYMFGTLSTVTGTYEMHMWAEANEGCRESTQAPGGHVDVTMGFTISSDVMDVFPNQLNLVLDAQYNFLGGQRNAQSCCGYNGNPNQLELKWQTMTSSFAPDSTAAQ